MQALADVLPLRLFRAQKGRAPVPSSLPGAFFVLEYNRENGVYILHVDDEDHTTYDLGEDIAELQVLFRTCLTDLVGDPLQHQQVDRLIDIAREFGMAQYIPVKGSLVEDRVLSILPRDSNQLGLNFNDQDDQKNWLPGLR